MKNTPLTALFLLLAGCSQISPPAPSLAAPIATAAPPAKPEEEPQVVEVMYYKTGPNGNIYGIPGPDDDLVRIIRHQNGKLWPGQPSTFDINTPTRGISVKKGVPPYLQHLTVISDANGIARVYLQPLPHD